MAILSRPRELPQERFDLEDWNALLAALRTDSKLNVKEFLSSGNLIYKGFTVTGIGLKSATVAMADATLIIPQNSFDFSWFTSAPAEPNIVISDADITDGARNYVEIELVTQNNTPLTKAFWDPEANSGAGAEFNQIVDTMTDLKVNMVVSTGGFSGSVDRLPLCIIDTDNSGTIKMILDRRELFGRLGKPSNIFHQFGWASKIEPVYSLTLNSVTGTFVANEQITIGGETATVVTGGTGSITFNEPTGINFANGGTVTGLSSGATGTINTVYENFGGADKDLINQKSINDALMTEIAKTKGVDIWYKDPQNSISDLAEAINSIITPFSTSAKYYWTGSILELTDNSGSPSSSDIIAKLRIFGQSSELNLLRADGTGGSATIPVANGQVLYVQLPASGNRSYSGIGSGSTNYQVSSRALFALSSSNYWIAYREGTKLVTRFQGDLSAGEIEPIGDTVPQTLLDNLGLVDTETPASYSSNIRGTANESLVSRIGVLTSAVGDEQEDRSGYLRSDTEVTWDGSTLQFASDIVLEFLNTKTGTLTQHKIIAGNSPITINNGDSIYASIDRSQTTENLTLINSSGTPIPAQLQANKNIFVFFKRIDAGGVKYLHLPFMKQMLNEGQTVRLGQAGTGAAIIKATYYDPVTTTLPSGASFTVDGSAVANGDFVLFSALSSNNNRIYKVSGVGTSIAWTAQRSFNGQFAPTRGDVVVITGGTGFADAQGEFNGTTFKFNDVVRYFNGTDYWEQTSLKTTSVTDNTTGTLFSVTASGSENWIMDYSVLRNGRKETGSAFVTHDGTNVRVVQAAAYISNVGVTFSGSISLGVLTVRWTTDSQGTGGTVKYSLKRWSDASGGPGGVPSYSGGGGGGGSAGGNPGDIQYNSSGILAGNSNFQIDTVDGSLSLNGLKISPLSAGIATADNQASPTSLFTFVAATYRNAVIEYSIQRNGAYRTGRLLIANDGSVTGENDDYVETAATGITLSSDISGGNVRVLYTSTATGFPGVFKYSIRKWS